MIALLLAILTLPGMVRHSVWGFYRHFAKDPHFYAQRCYAQPWRLRQGQGVLLCVGGVWLALEGWPWWSPWVPYLWLLVWVSICDLKVRLIPLRAVLALILWWACWQPQLLWQSLQDFSVWVLLCVGILAKHLLRTKVGGGDFYLMLALLCVHGSPDVLYVILLACVLALGYNGLCGRGRSTLAWGPFLALSSWCWVMAYR